MIYFATRLIYLSLNPSGKGQRIEDAYFESDKFQEMNDYAQSNLKENTDPNRKPEYIFTHHCGTFAYDIAEQDEDLNTPWMGAPRPLNIGDNYQNNVASVEFKPGEGTTIEYDEKIISYNFQSGETSSSQLFFQKLISQVMKISSICMVVALLFGCSHNQVKAPKRPENVPEAAEWYGGTDGGAWSVVRKVPSEHHFNLEVYSDHNGLVWAKGVFKLNPECSNEKVYTVDEIRNSISAWTGETMLLKIKGSSDRLCSLVPVPK